MAATPYTGVLTLESSDGQVETQLLHCSAVSDAVAAFKMGAMSRESVKSSDEKPVRRASLILFRGEHYDRMPQGES